MAYVKYFMILLLAGMITGCRTLQGYKPLGYKPVEQVYQEAQARGSVQPVSEKEPLQDLEVSEDKARVITSMAGSNVMFDQEDAYAKGYRAGVKENISLIQSEFVGNNFPYYYWQAPMVQKVFMPARIVGGCYVPAHHEYVIVLPGEWREKYAYPIGNQKKRLKAASYFQERKQAEKDIPKQKVEVQRGVIPATEIPTVEILKPVAELPDVQKEQEITQETPQ